MYLVPLPPYHRKINPLVADVTGKSVLMTRFFKSIKPPPELLESGDSKASATSIAWFVSLIPYLPNNGLFPGLQDIWPTCDQILHMMVGSEIEHAMLLCNFFTTIGKKAFLVLGQGVPEGDTAYVLTVEESGEQDRLWNPMTAESFSISETFCPLESVYAIANENNIWGNIQLSDKPNRIRWDFAQGTIHILRKCLYSTKFNLIAKFYIKTGFFRLNKKSFFYKNNVLTKCSLCNL